MAETATIDEAVNRAVQEHAPEIKSNAETQTQADNVSQVDDKSTQAETVKPEQIDKPEFDIAEARQALMIVKALNDPKSSKTAIEILAREAGLKIQDEGQSTKSAVKDVLADLKDGVPEEMHFVLDGLKPAIEKLIRQNVEKETAVIKNSIEEQQRTAVQSNIDKAYSTMRDRYKDFDEVETAMGELSEDMPMKPGSNMVDYLDKLYKIATYDKKTSASVSRAVDKINRNAKEASIASAETQETQVKTGSRLPSIDEAVRNAFAGKRLIG